MAAASAPRRALGVIRPRTPAYAAEMSASRPVLAKVLIDSGLVDASTLDELEGARRQGRRLGSLMIERRLITAARLLEVVSRQLGMPWIKLEGVDLDAELAKLVPA